MPTLPNKRESGGGADGARFSTRHSRIMILSLTFGSLAMIGAVWFYYTRQRQATEEAAGKELAAVAAAKTVQIANWRRERIGDGRILMSTLINRLDARVLPLPIVPSCLM